MSTSLRPVATRIPPLENGDRLSRAEFERRYEAMPDVRAELIEGIVYLMASPVRHNRHAQPHLRLCTWLGVYVSATSGVDAGDNGSIRLDLDNEPQPDAYLFLLPERGGTVRISEDGYLEGAPEFVAEVASSSVSIDLGDKLHVYLRNGVREYLVWRVLDRAIDWFVLRNGRYETLAPDVDGLLKSPNFPGLWLDVEALMNDDLTTVLTALQRGLAAPEHAVFVAQPRGDEV